MSDLGDGVTSTVASEDGVTSMTDSDGDGEFIVDSDDDSDDGVFPEGDGDSDDGVFPPGDGDSDDRVFPDGDGDSAVGEGLSDNAQTLSVVVEPALLSTSVVALHVVQFVQVFWLDAVENFPVGHATQVRSVVAVPLAAIFWPATQLFQSVQE